MRAGISGDPGPTLPGVGPEHGVKLGRQHRFGIDYRALTALPHNGQNHKKKACFRCYTPEYEEWERKNMSERVTTG